MSRPRIDLVGPPFHGHLHPLVGMAEVLREIAEVRIFTTADAAGDLRALGFEAVDVLRGREAEVWRIANTPVAVRSRPWMMARQLAGNLRLLPALRAELAAAWREVRPDVAIVDFTLPSVGGLARELGVRWWTSHPSPLAIESPDGTPAYLGGWSPPRGRLGRWRDAAGRRMVRGFKRAVFAAARGPLRAAGLAGVYRRDGSEAVYSDEVILALGRRELEFPQRWPAAVRFIGPVLRSPGAGRGEAVRLDPARRNVLVTIGTHLPFRRAEMQRELARWAAAGPEIFFHYSAAGFRGPDAEAGENWRVYDYVNYEENVGAFDAVVHHAGAGITYHALAAGRPAVVMPCDYDQFDFAARLEFHGLAVRCRRPGALPRVLRAALADAGLRARVGVMAERLRAGDWRRELRAVWDEQRARPRPAVVS